jgi:peptidoglycan hydrolase-like protein with peptidoglycan-binding domain
LATYRARRQVPLSLAAGSIVVALVVGGAAGALGMRAHDKPTTTAGLARDGTTSTTTSAPRTTSGGAGATSSPVVPSTAPPPLAVASISPTSGAAGVAPDAAITVTFSSRIAARSPLPRLTPSTPGSWRSEGAALIFTPGTDYIPLSEETVSVPGGPSGVVSADGARLARTVSESFSVANGSVLRLQQLLSLLEYSPLAWTPTGTAIARADTAAQVAALYTPPPGNFAWRSQGWPASLRPLWQQGRYNVFTEGLVMSFQADHGLTPNGDVGPGLWAALTAALGANTVNTGGYDYAFAEKAAPESLTVYHDGKVVLKSPANTGIAGSPTPDGTFAVYTRLRSQVMRGTNPDLAYGTLVTVVG